MREQKQLAVERRVLTTYSQGSVTKEERKIGGDILCLRRGPRLSSKRVCPEGRRERSPLGWVVVALDGEGRGGGKAG